MPLKHNRNFHVLPLPPQHVSPESLYEATNYYASYRNNVKKNNVKINTDNNTIHDSGLNIDPKNQWETISNVDVVVSDPKLYMIPAGLPTTRLRGHLAKLPHHVYIPNTIGHFHRGFQIIDDEDNEATTLTHYTNEDDNNNNNNNNDILNEVIEIEDKNINSERLISSLSSMRCEEEEGEEEENKQNNEEKKKNDIIHKKNGMQQEQQEEEERSNYKDIKIIRYDKNEEYDLNNGNDDLGIEKHNDIYCNHCNNCGTGLQQQQQLCDDHTIKLAKSANEEEIINQTEFVNKKQILPSTKTVKSNTKNKFGLKKNQQYMNDNNKLFIGRPLPFYAPSLLDLHTNRIVTKEGLIPPYVVFVGLPLCHSDELLHFALKDAFTTTPYCPRLICRNKLLSEYLLKKAEQQQHSVTHLLKSLLKKNIRSECNRTLVIEGIPQTVEECKMLINILGHPQIMGIFTLNNKERIRQLQTLGVEEQQELINLSNEIHNFELRLPQIMNMLQSGGTVIKVFDISKRSLIDLATLIRHEILTQLVPAGSI